eukprot:8509094-Ditylum_brightwellii.AAC.1
MNNFAMTFNKQKNLGNLMIMIIRSSIAPSKKSTLVYRMESIRSSRGNIKTMTPSAMKKPIQSTSSEACQSATTTAMTR